MNCKYIAVLCCFLLGSCVSDQNESTSTSASLADLETKGFESVSSFFGVEKVYTYKLLRKSIEDNYKGKFENRAEAQQFFYNRNALKSPSVEIDDEYGSLILEFIEKNDTCCFVITCILHFNESGFSHVGGGVSHIFCETESKDEPASSTP